jgi:hypothetical protein
MRWAWYAACMGDMRQAYKIIVGKPEGTRPLRKPTRRWEGDVRMYRRESGWDVVDLFIWLKTVTSVGLL